MNRTLFTLLVAASFVVLACNRADVPKVGDAAKSAATSATPTQPAPTNRIDIPAAVRQNLAITFAKVESRAVAETLRVPGQFELLPTARREYRAPLGGRVELRAAQYAMLSRGDVLYEIDSIEWRDLEERIASGEAKVASMGPIREAHRVHEASLTRKVELWKERLLQLDEIRNAGGGNATQTTDARATLVETEAELADVMEKDAALDAEQKLAESELRAARARRASVLRATGGEPNTDGMIVVRAADAGLVETIAVTNGGLVEAGAPVLVVLQPEKVRFRAHALQSDLGRLRDGLAARIVPPVGGTIALDDSMTGTLELAPAADADARTIGLLVTPASLARWARAGVAGYLELVLAGGREELAIPSSAVVRDGTVSVIFRRDPANADKVIRLEADLGVSDGRWVELRSGVKLGDEIVVGGNYQLMLASSGSAPKGGHFHSDGTFHEGED